MKIVVLDAYTGNPGDLSWEKFEALGDLVLYDRTSPDEIVERCSGADIVLTNKVKLQKAEIDALPELKYIGVLATGTNVIDLDYARSKEIDVTNVPGYSTDAVAQHVIAMMLHFSSMVSIHNEAVHKDDWVNSPDFCFTLGTIRELSGKTLGVVGLGSIGRNIAKIADALGMKICAAQQSSMNSLQVPYDVEWLSVDEVFAKADYITLNCPLTPKTDKLVNADRLKSMKPSAYIINTGRGPLIDEQALADALNNNTIAGAGLDVLSSEPPSADNPLLSAKNCVITPHIAWASIEARGKLHDIAADNIRSFQNGSTVNLVN
ncbi:MAG: D-2-hydroxyacid dehydrogenase [Lentisphaeraceae bacterium]|nr:D-2-hydroxyacid dehydrogenase [Lentisphaeraceae bacterium]